MILDEEDRRERDEIEREERPARDREKDRMRRARLGPEYDIDSDYEEKP